MLRATILWVVGLLTLVPYGAYYLLFEAPREHYAPLIVGLCFWLFGYWGLVGTVMFGIKARAVYRTLQTASSREDLLDSLRSAQAREVAVELIAKDNHVPRFVARGVWALLARRLAASPSAPASPGRPP